MDKTRNPPDLKPAEERLSDQGYEDVRRRQVRLGLKLTPAERLRWLEAAIRTFGRWRGKATKNAG